MRRIVCFGDSNTYGHSPVDGQRYGDDISWPGVLGHLLGDGFEVINEGKNGRTIAFDDPYMEGCNGMSDIGACIEEHAPIDLIIIMLGTNDLKVYFDSNPQAVAGHLKEMCELVRQKTDAEIIVASPTLLGDQIEFSPLHLEFGRMQVDYSFELAPEFQKVAAEVGAEFVDLAMVAVSSDVDCLHLMPEEHAKVAQAMKDKVFTVFKEDLEREAAEEEAAREAELKKIQEEEAQRQKEEEERAREQERLQAEEMDRQREEEEQRIRAEKEERLQEEEETGFQEEAEVDEEVDAEAKRRVEELMKAAEEEVAREENSLLENDLTMAGQEAAAGIFSAEESETETLDSLTFRTEKEKMLSGRLYKCDDELKREMSLARKITRAYNETGVEEEEKRAEILQKLFKHAGKESYIEPPFHCDYGSHISVGDNFYANFNCIMLDVADIKIGDHVFFGPGVSIYTAGHPIYAPVRNELLEFGKEVTIGDDVWIGGNVTINPGVHIGNNVVIGSGSVVTGDIPDGVVAVGNPCRILRRISDSDKQYWEEKKEEHDA